LTEVGAVLTTLNAFALYDRLSATSRPVVVAINKKDIAATGAHTPHAAQTARSNSNTKSRVIAADATDVSASLEGEGGDAESSSGDTEDGSTAEARASGSDDRGDRTGRRGGSGAISLAAMTLPALRELWHERLPNAGECTVLSFLLLSIPVRARLAPLIDGAAYRSSVPVITL
jgi:hypothetical protein